MNASRSIACAIALCLACASCEYIREVPNMIATESDVEDATGYRTSTALGPNAETVNVELFEVPKDEREEVEVKARKAAEKHFPKTTVRIVFKTCQRRVNNKCALDN